MRKVLSIFIVGILTLSLAACGSDEVTADSGADSTVETSSESIEDDEAQESSEDEKASSSESTTSGGTLIVFFSPSNSDAVDALTSATPRVGDTPFVEYIAQTIGENVEADIAMIVPDAAYPLDYDETADLAKDERDNNERPTFSLDVNPEDYDTIFVGYPIWWYGLPMVMETFFDTYDFSGKTIIPFNAHLGSRDGGTYDGIAEREPDATVLDGIAFSINDADEVQGDVSEWLTGLGY